ncbi:MAG: hypothetical protein DMG39_11685 [Acidobacteria bacterium]|nr:MAG: hypothetical protein DMG39_11685 [Acidobacteriota bacterium]
MRGSVKVPTLIVLMCVLAVPAFAERKDKPTGEEIANKAKAAKFDSANSTAGEKIGKKVKLTPAKLDHVKSEAELEGGQIIGMLETEAPGDETGLPPGKYNVFAAKVGNDWHVYAESGGKIVVEAVHVRVEKSNDRTPKKPEFHAEGWCSWWWLLPPWGLVTFVFTNCF